MIMRLQSLLVMTAFLMNSATRVVAFAPGLNTQPSNPSLSLPTASWKTSSAPFQSAVSMGNHKRTSPSTALFAVTTEDLNKKITELAPSGVFLLSAAALLELFVQIQQADLTLTPGTWALIMTTLAVAYDNLIIGLGKPLFPQARTNTAQHDLLRHLSFPRFTAHAVFVPFLYATTAELGQVCGVEWLQGAGIQTAVLVAATVLGVVSRVRFVNSSGIILADQSDDPDVPEDAWERNLLWFTYEDVSVLYILPAIVLALANLVVGIQAFQQGTDHTSTAAWLIVSAVAVLYGNAKPSYVARFTGNLAEVVMLWALFEAVVSVAR